MDRKIDQRKNRDAHLINCYS